MIEYLNAVLQQLDPGGVAMLFTIIATPVISFLLWLFFGRDPKTGITVEFCPPRGLNPAETGYIIDGIVDSRDMVSLIIHFANEGYLTITEEKESLIYLEKEKNLPPDAEDYKKTLFEGLFRSSARVKLDDLKIHFYPELIKAQRQLRNHFTKDKRNRIFTQNSIGAQFIASILMAIPLISLIFLGGDYEFTSLDTRLLAIPLLLGSLICYLVLINIYNRMHSISTAKIIKGRILAGLILLFCLMGISLFAIYYYHTIVYSIMAVIASLVCWLFATFMKQRTRSSIALLGKLLGFREFIRTAEADQIKKLNGDNPNYFYHVLPYAYIFGLTERWAEKFVNMPISAPEWYKCEEKSCHFNIILFINSFIYCTRRIQSNIIVPPSTGRGDLGGGDFFRWWRLLQPWHMRR